MKHRDFTSYYDELHYVPGNAYTQQNNQCCKYVTVAKAGDLGLYYRSITQASFLLKHFHYVFTVSAAQAFLQATYEWGIVQFGKRGGASLDEVQMQTRRTNSPSVP
jgi:hypothetical protein